LLQRKNASLRVTRKGLHVSYFRPTLLVRGPFTARSRRPEHFANQTR